MLIVVIVNKGSLNSDVCGRGDREAHAGGKFFRVSIEIIKDRCGRDIYVVIVAHREQCLVEIPENGDTGGIFETAIINHIAEGEFRDRVLLQQKFVVNVDAKVAHENIES